MAGIDFSKFSQDFKAKFEKAIADKKIYAEEFQEFSAEDQAELSRQLASTPGHIGDIIVIQNAYESKQGTLEFYAGASSQEGKIELSQDTINKYPDAGKFGNFNKGVVTILDKDGKVLKDSLGNPIKFDFSTDLEIDSTVDNVQGGFETIEGENFQRTNRRFAIALIRSMYNKVIMENQEMLKNLGLLNASLWREGLGMGIQKIADSIDADQKAITATTIKRIEQITEERDKICDALEKQLDNPSGFSDEFSKLVGSNFSDMNFDKLRETCHNKENEKDDTIRYNKTVEDFKEMYPDNNVTKYLEGNFVTQSLDKMVKLCDSVADILVMFWATGGIGGTLGKASMKGFANSSKFFIENIGKKNYKEAIAQLPKLSSFMAGAAHSAPTMSAFEGGKALINSTTNSEDLTADEILSRTIDGFISGAEMGVEMAGLQTFAIAPIMNKLSPVVGKMTGASSKIKELLKKNGEMSLEDISKVYDDCIQTTRGKIAQEGLHLGVSLPIMIPGFTGIDSAKAFLSNGDNNYKEDEFREQLLKEAKTQEERVRISAMNSFELKAEFVKRNFQAQLEGMTTIEGVSLALRRFQAARLAGQAVPKPVNNLLGAKIKTVEKDGKPLYEVVQENGKTLTFDMDKGGNVSQFSSPEHAIAAYQAMCVKIVNEFKAELEKADNVSQANTQEAREQGDARTVLSKDDQINHINQTDSGIPYSPNEIYNIISHELKNNEYFENSTQHIKRDLVPLFEKNPNLFLKLLHTKSTDSNGMKRCLYSITELKKIASIEPTDLVEKFIDKKYANGSPVFESYDVLESLVRTENSDFMLKLVTQMAENGFHNWNSCDFISIDRFLSKNPKIKEELLENPNIDVERIFYACGSKHHFEIDPRFDNNDAIELLNIPEDAFNNYIHLSKLKEKYGFQQKNRFSTNETIKLAKLLNDKQNNFIRELIYLDNVNFADLESFCELRKEYGTDVEEFALAKTFNGDELRFKIEDIQSLCESKRKNPELFDYLYNANGKSMTKQNEYKYSATEIMEYVNLSKNESTSKFIMEKLEQDKNFTLTGWTPSKMQLYFTYLNNVKSLKISNETKNFANNLLERTIKNSYNENSDINANIISLCCQIKPENRKAVSQLLSFTKIEGLEQKLSTIIQLQAKPNRLTKLADLKNSKGIFKYLSLMDLAVEETYIKSEFLSHFKFEDNQLSEFAGYAKDPSISIDKIIYWATGLPENVSSSCVNSDGSVNYEKIIEESKHNTSR